MIHGYDVKSFKICYELCVIFRWMLQPGAFQIAICIFEAECKPTITLLLIDLL
jgi:hypothetical protein